MGKRVGRPSKDPEGGVRPAITFRCRKSLADALRSAAIDGDLSMSDMMHRILEAHFASPDLRSLIREEIRAALAERNESLMNAALAMVAAAPVPPKLYRY